MLSVSIRVFLNSAALGFRRKSFQKTIKARETTQILYMTDTWLITQPVLALKKKGKAIIVSALTLQLEILRLRAQPHQHVI